jgi:hypothetical protein
LFIFEHFADHFPGDVHVSILDEVESYVRVVFVERGLEDGLVESESVHGVFYRETLVAARVLDQHLNFRLDTEQMVRSSQHDLEQLLIKVSHAEVQVKQRLIWVVLNVLRDQHDFLLDKGNLRGHSSLLHRSSKHLQLLVVFVTFFFHLHPLFKRSLVCEAEETARLGSDMANYV